MSERVDTVAPVRGRPRDPYLDAAILESTLLLLASSGVHGMSLADVATAAGTTKVSIYKRFHSKAELIGAALAHLQIDHQPVLTGQVQSDLALLLGAMRSDYDRVGLGLIGACLTAESHHPELLKIVRDKSLQVRRTGFRDALLNGVETGQLRSDLDLDLVISVIIGAFFAEYLAGRPMDEEWDGSVVKLVLGDARAN